MQLSTAANIKALLLVFLFREGWSASHQYAFFVLKIWSPRLSKIAKFWGSQATRGTSRFASFYFQSLRSQHRGLRLSKRGVGKRSWLLTESLCLGCVWFAEDLLGRFGLAKL